MPEDLQSPKTGTPAQIGGDTAVSTPAGTGTPAADDRNAGTPADQPEQSAEDLRKLLLAQQSTIAEANRIIEENRQREALEAGTRTAAGPTGNANDAESEAALRHERAELEKAAAAGDLWAIRELRKEDEAEEERARTADGIMWASMSGEPELRDKATRIYQDPRYVGRFQGGLKEVVDKLRQKETKDKLTRVEKERDELAAKLANGGGGAPRLPQTKVDAPRTGGPVDVSGKTVQAIVTTKAEFVKAKQQALENGDDDTYRSLQKQLNAGQIVFSDV